MTTVLQYLVIAAVIGLVIFGIAVVIFGRGEQMAPLSPRTSPTELPDVGMTGDDVRSMRFAMALRGYRMSDVDWALERMADEVDRLKAQVTALSGGSERQDPAPKDTGAETLVSTSGPTPPHDRTTDPATDAGTDQVPDATTEISSGARS
ncbi:DivIVA domain-containing protein [Nakamurella sp. GG22]